MKTYTTPEVSVRSNALRASILAGSNATATGSRKMNTTTGLDGVNLKGSGVDGRFKAADYFDAI